MLPVVCTGEQKVAGDCPICQVIGVGGGWVNTLLAPINVPSHPPHSPPDPPISPVPCTDSPALTPVPSSPIQSHPPSNGCPSQSAFSGGLKPVRLSADRMPMQGNPSVRATYRRPARYLPTPPPPKKRSPLTPQFRSQGRASRPPSRGNWRSRREGKPSLNTTPKTGDHKKTGTPEAGRSLPITPISAGRLTSFSLGGGSKKKDRGCQVQVNRTRTTVIPG